MFVCRSIDRERESVFSPFPQADDAAPSSSSSSIPKTHYVIVREDLPKGFLTAHVAHAAGESGPAPPGSIAVVLGVPNDAELLAIDAHLTARGIAHILIHEDSGPYQDQATAIGLTPTSNRALARKVLSALPLVR